MFYCENPSQSQNTAESIAGVDVVGFGIGVARKDVWGPSIAVVEATQPQ